MFVYFRFKIPFHIKSCLIIIQIKENIKIMIPLPFFKNIIYHFIEKLTKN